MKKISPDTRIKRLAVIAILASMLPPSLHAAEKCANPGGKFLVEKSNQKKDDGNENRRFLKKSAREKVKMSLAYEMLNRWIVSFLPGCLRTPEAAPELQYYGTGESAHWAVQSNMNVCGALAVAGVLDADQKKIDTALRLFRYALRTHVTGDLKASDGKSWGQSWISVLGAERMTHGVNALWPYLTEDDRSRYRKLRLCEADFLWKDYEVSAGMCASSGKNHPESNIWNGGFLWRAALDYPDAPNAAGYREKGTSFLLNGLSQAADAADENCVDGKPIRAWHVGFNFTPNWSLDHHGYMNVGYSLIALSNLGMLHFNFREKKQTPPAALAHHAADCWNVVRHFFFPDGRLLRVGGDSRTRYTYCQSYALPALLYAADFLHDPTALSLAEQMLELIRKEQSGNADGSFYGNRLTDVKNGSHYYYTRLESDPAAVLSQYLYWKEKFSFAPALPVSSAPWSWHDEYHNAAVLTNDTAIRSFVQRGTNCSPLALCVPSGRSDMAEWCGNLFTHIGLRKIGNLQEASFLRTGKDFFLAAGSCRRRETDPCGEGEGIYDLVDTRFAAAGLPDGRSMVVLEFSRMLKEATLTNVMTINLNVPNDVYNRFQRSYRGKNFRYTGTAIPEKAEQIDTGVSCLVIDETLAVALLRGGKNLILHRPSRRTGGVIGRLPEMRSIYCEYLGADFFPGFHRFRKNEVIADTVCAVSVTGKEDFGADAEVRAEGTKRVVELTGCDQVRYRISADFEHPEKMTMEKKTAETGSWEKI